MADLAVTAANVQTTATTVTNGIAGETITAGAAVYQKAADGRFWKAQCDGTAEEATFAGIALNGAAAGQPLAVQTAGPITIGGTPTVGTLYVVSAAAGAICPWADLVSTNKVALVGYGKSATQIQIAPLNTGVAIP